MSGHLSLILAGAGKSVLASIVINDLEARANASGGSICVAYVFFRYSDAAGLTLRTVMEILVKQTVERHPECLPLCEQTYSRHLKEGTRPTEQELTTLLSLFNQQFKVTFYVLDALDEAPVILRLKLVQKLSSLGARLFITSRPLPAVEAKFPAAHTFSIHAHDQDLDIHIADKIEESAELQELLEADPGFGDLLVSTVKAKCEGMYV